MNGLNIISSGTYLDLTFGGGGHSREILNRLSDEGRLIAFDRDEDVVRNALNDPRFKLFRSNFRFLKNFLRYYDIDEVDGVLADLGVSSHHFDDAERGFSFRFEGDLDMRMNRSAELTAAAVLNDYTEQQLSDLFYRFGELRNARSIARAIVSYREKEGISATMQLIDVLQPFIGRSREKKILAQVFQALRIEVNDEIGSLKEMLVRSLEMLRPGGRICVISYHSLEDRLVKNFLRSGNFEGQVKKDFYGNPETPFQLINRKVIVPSEKEQRNNPRSRSAKLRIAEKK